MLEEAALGDADVAARRLAHLAGVASLAITAPAQALATSLVGSGLLPGKAAADSLHIAIAAVHGIDYLLTWNIRHLAHAAIRGRIEAVCGEAGFPPPVLCTPEELLEG